MSCTEPKDVLLTERDLAERWGLKPSSLASQRSQGRGVPWVKIGRSARYRLSDVITAEQTVYPRVAQ